MGIEGSATVWAAARACKIPAAVVAAVIDTAMVRHVHFTSHVESVLSVGIVEIGSLPYFTFVAMVSKAVLVIPRRLNSHATPH
jgi:hypothetical protein